MVAHLNVHDCANQSLSVLVTFSNELIDILETTEYGFSFENTCNNGTLT